MRCDGHIVCLKNELCTQNFRLRLEGKVLFRGHQHIYEYSFKVKCGKTGYEEAGMIELS